MRWAMHSAGASPRKANAPESSPISCRRRGGEHPRLQTDSNMRLSMTQEQFFKELGVVISNDRFEPHRRGHTRNSTSAYASYAWNIALCESLYPALNCFEVALRNSIHTAATEQFGTEFWFNSRLGKDEADRLSILRSRIDSPGNRNPSAGELVSGLSLGFWVSLFKGYYERVLWPLLLPAVFPYSPRRQRARREISKRVDRIRRLRNRVFHHEPIWHWQDLEQQHQQILETIGWISPAMLAMTRLLDRFPSVYTRGGQPYAIELENIAQKWAR